MSRSTRYAALDGGLPMVNVPIGMDQLENAGRCAALGLGVTEEFPDLSVDAIRAAVREVLGDAKYRENAQRMQREMQALPAPSDVVALLERQAAEQRPYAEAVVAQI